MISIYNSVYSSWMNCVMSWTWDLYCFQGLSYWLFFYLYLSSLRSHCTYRQMLWCGMVVVSITFIIVALLTCPSRFIFARQLHDLRPAQPLIFKCPSSVGILQLSLGEIGLVHWLSFVKKKSGSACILLFYHYGENILNCTQHNWWSMLQRFFSVTLSLICFVGMIILGMGNHQERFVPIQCHCYWC